MSEHNDTINHQYYDIILEYMKGFRNDTVDFTKPYMKPFFNNSWPFIVVVYGALIVLSLIANVAMIYHVFKHGLHEKAGSSFFINVAVANILHVAVPLPITIINMLLHNWIFGKFMCYFLPMLQVSTVTIIVMNELFENFILQ